NVGYPFVCDRSRRSLPRYQGTPTRRVAVSEDVIGESRPNWQPRRDPASSIFTQLARVLRSKRLYRSFPQKGSRPKDLFMMCGRSSRAGNLRTDLLSANSSPRQRTISAHHIALLLPVAHRV